jgi:hypothetical protein
MHLEIVAMMAFQKADPGIAESRFEGMLGQFVYASLARQKCPICKEGFMLDLPRLVREGDGNLGDDQI